MPDFDLKELEAEAIAEFLMAQREGEIPEPPASASGDVVRRGEQLFKEKYPCLACHRVEGRGGEVGPDLTEVGARLTGAWLVPWLQGPQRLDPGSPMVNLGLSESEATDIARYLLSLRAARTAAAPATGEQARLRAQGEALVRELGCAGCHRVGAIPPPADLPRLFGIGDKLRSDWLTAYLHSRVQIRPWLRARMPEFRLSTAESRLLTEYLLSLRDSRLPPLPRRLTFTGNTSPARVEAGRLLASREYFDCGSCHVQGTRLPQGPRAGWAPDLVLAGQRLQPDWIVRWLQDPQRFEPGTRMPSFFSDAHSGPDDILGGNEEEQILALRDYLVGLGKAGGGQP
jgi:mono/diheme cytochrome c family protein